MTLVSARNWPCWSPISWASWRSGNLFLAGRRELHELSGATLSRPELRGGLVFAAAALILLPLLLALRTH
jgi:hypothetical protein